MERSSAGPTAFVLAALLVATTGAAAQSTASARKAAEIADLALTALGGRDAWEGTRYIRFTFLRGETALKLTWDKWSGRSRLDATAEDGRPYVVLMNVNTKQGHAYLAGEPLQGEILDEYLNRAFRVWKGETYWLLAPYKLRDPHVTLRHDGRDTLDGITYDTLHLSFEDIDTSGDEFWVGVCQPGDAPSRSMEVPTGARSRR